MRLILLQGNNCVAVFRQFPGIDREAEQTIWDIAMLIVIVYPCTSTRSILCMCPANERRRYIVTSFLIGPAYTQNDIWKYSDILCDLVGYL